MTVNWAYLLALSGIGIFLARPLCGAQEGRDGLLPPAAQDHSGLVTQIRAALAANEDARAQREIDRLSAEEPRNFEGSFWSGYLSFRQGRNYDAIRALRRAEALDANLYVLKMLAVSYYGAHQYRLFLLKMNEALRKNSEDDAPYYYLGRYYDSDENDFPRAAEYFRQALARQANHFRAHYYLGHCYEVEQKAEQAEGEYQRALTIAESQNLPDSLPYQGLARLRLAASHPADALPFARRAVELAPRDAAAHKLLARAFTELNRSSEAASEWKISSELDPTDVTALYRLYRSYLAAHQDQKATATLARYKKIVNLYGTN